MLTVPYVLENSWIGEQLVSGPPEPQPTSTMAAAASATTDAPVRTCIISPLGGRNLFSSRGGPRTAWATRKPCCTTRHPPCVHYPQPTVSRICLAVATRTSLCGHREYSPINNGAVRDL